MVTTLQRDNLIQQHVSALTKLGTTYQTQFFQFFNVLNQKNDDEIGDFIFNSLPLFNRPFQQASRTLGQRFIDLRAKQSGKPALPDVRDLQSYTSKVKEINDSASGLLKSLTLKQREGYVVTNDTIIKSMERSVVDTDRAVTLSISLDTDDIDSVQVGVRTDGCDFCKSLSVDGVTGFSGQADFHNNCRCVFDASFKGDPAYKQSFHKDFSERYSAAKSQITSGDLGDRVLSTRSKEWTAQNKREITAKLREERKIWEEDYRPSSNAKAERRSKDAEMVNDIMDKALKGEPLSEQQTNALTKSDLVSPFDPNQLYNPIYRPWKTTNRDVIKLMQAQTKKEIFDLEKKFNQ